MVVLLYNLGKLLSEYKGKIPPFLRLSRRIMTEYALVHSFGIGIDISLGVPVIDVPKLVRTLGIDLTIGGITKMKYSSLKSIYLGKIH